MATTKNITMKQFNGTDYDTLYPKTKVEQVEGAYSQQQILADSTKELYGLPNTAVPDEPLALLARLNRGLCNDYLWEKYIEKQKESYTETAHGSGDAFISSVSADSSASRTYYYGDSYTVNSDGTVKLTNQKTLTITDSQHTASALSVLVGKWFYSTRDGRLNKICNYIPAGSTISQKNVGNAAFPSYNFYSSKGWTHRENFGTQVDKQNLSYVNSPNSDTFPPAVSDGYTYSFCGRIGEKVVVEKGSYTGTGFEGKTLYFRAPPKLVIILSTSSSSLALSPGIFTTKSRLCVSYSLSGSGYFPSAVALTWSENNTKVVIAGELFNKSSSGYDYFVFY